MNIEQYRPKNVSDSVWALAKEFEAIEVPLYRKKLFENALDDCRALDENEYKNTDLEVLKALGKILSSSYPELTVKFRQELRTTLLAEALTNDKMDTTFEIEFSGSGDSGNIDNYTDIDAVDLLLEHYINTKVTVDWYNNDGGGGDITWSLSDDKIILNSFYNVMESVSGDNEVHL